MTSGALTAFLIANDVAKCFCARAVLRRRAALAQAIDVINLRSPAWAILPAYRALPL
jgi:high-affinity K+ transport system ATPase subunit B